MDDETKIKILSDALRLFADQVNWDKQKGEYIWDYGAAISGLWAPISPMDIAADALKKAEE